MGTVSPATHLTLDVHKQIMQEIILPTIAGLDAEGRRYQGVLYAGLMMTDTGPARCWSSTPASATPRRR